MLKLSRYNWLVEANNDYLLNNGLTGAIALLDTKYVNQIKKLINQDSSVDDCIACMNEEIVSKLVKAGVLIDIGFDERLYMQHLYEMSRHSIAQGYTVVPTLRCNFACPYCYEDGGQDCAEDMSDSVVDKIVELATKADREEFSIALTGGEPTLVPDVLLSILSRVQHVTQARGAKFKGRLVTNGFLLDNELSIRLGKYGVEQMQVTLDGDRHQHNRRRPLRSGGDTFDKIVANICTAAQHIKRIRVRVNTDHDESNQYDSVKGIFDEYSNIDVYHSPTRYPDTDVDRTDKNFTYSYKCENTSITSLKKYTSFSMPSCTAVKTNTCKGVGG